MPKRVLATVATVAVLLAVPAPALAHGIGGRQDLPVPLSFFVIGAGIALVVSFLAVSTRWREPRLQDGPEERPVKWSGVIWFYRALPWIGMAGFLLVLIGGIVDGDESRNNIAPVLVWVYFWLVIPFVAALKIFRWN